MCVQISTGGLEDSDIEDVNPFASPPNYSHTLTVAGLTKGAHNAKQDHSRQNEVIYASLCNLVKSFSYESM